MHNGIIDKKRRKLNLHDMKIEEVLPEHFVSAYPKFISLLERYYEFQNENDSTELLRHLLESRDINATDITLLDFIEDELLLGQSYYQGFSNKRAASNFSSVLFRSKGTKYSIEWFFRSFFQIDPEILYPKENIFKIGNDESLIGPDSFRYLTDDQLYQTFALLIRCEIPLSKWRDLFKLFVHPAGMYLGSEVLLESIASLGLEEQPEAATDTRISPVLNITSNTNPITEGLEVQFSVSGTNAQEGIYYYELTHISTNNDDFVDDFPVGKQQFTITTDQTYIENPADNDNIDVEGTVTNATPFYTNVLRNDFFATGSGEENNDEETFSIAIYDWRYQELQRATFTQTVRNVHWDLSVPTFTETGVAQTVTITGYNLPAVATSDPIPVKWWIEHVSTVNGDFDFSAYANPPTSAPFGVPVTVSAVGNAGGNAGTFDIIPVKDYVTEGNETFRIHLVGPGVDENGDTVEMELLDYLVGDGKLSTISDTSIYPRYVIDSFPDITEGGNITIDVSTVSGTPNSGDGSEHNPAGDTISWSLDNNANGRIGTTSGNITIDASPDNGLAITGTSVDGYYRGSTNVQITLTNNDGITTQDTLAITDAAPSNFVISGPTSIGEGGGTESWDLTIDNGVPGSNYYWYVDGADNADFTSTPPRSGSRATLTVDSTANSVTAGGGTMIMTSSMQLAAATDGPVENESFTIRVYDASTGGTEVASYAVDITDETVTYGDVDPLSQTVVEGNDISFTINATLVGGASYENFNWTITDDGSGRYSTSGTILSSAFTSGGGSVTVDITTTNDPDIQGQQTLTITGSGATYGNSPSANGSVTLNDAAAVYELDVDNTSLAENSGGTFTFDMGASSANIPDGTYNFWLIAPATGTSAVFTGGSRDLSFNGGDAPTASSRLAVTITNNQISNVTGLGAVTSIPIDVVDDVAVTGDLEFRGVIGTTGGVARDTTGDLTIVENDVPAPTYTIQGSDPLTVSEVAAAQTITVNTTNVSDGTFLFWNITTDAPGTTEATTDWQAYNSAGLGFEINSNTGNFTIDATADAFTDGSTETFYLHVRTGSDAGTSVDSIELQVTDDSQTPAGPTYEIVTTGKTTLSEPSAGITHWDTNTLLLLGTASGSPPVSDTTTTNVTNLDTVHTKIQGASIAVHTTGTNSANSGNYTPNRTTVTANPEYLNQGSSWGTLTYTSSNFTQTTAFSIANNNRPAVGPNAGGTTYGSSNYVDPDFELKFLTEDAGTYNAYFNALTTGTDDLDNNWVGRMTGSVSVVGETTYTVNTTNVSDGTVLYWEATPVSGTNSSNWVPGYISDDGATTSASGNNLRGTVEINSNTGNFTIRLNHRDSRTTNCTFNIVLRTGSHAGTTVETSETITITPAAKYLTAAFDVSSINENGSDVATYTLTTSGVANGTTVTYYIRGSEGNISVLDNDIEISTDGVNYSTLASLFGTLTINSNSANLYFRAVADSTTETTQKIIIDIDEEDSAGNTTNAYERLNGSTETRYGAGNNPSAAVTINDTSQGATFNLSGGTFREDIGIAQQADAGVRFNSNGTVTKTNSLSSGSIGADDWINAGSQAAGVGNNYQILFTTSSGSDPTVTVGGTVNGSYVYGSSWIGLDGNNSIECIVGAGDFPNADSSVVSVTIKEWDGVTANLGTGTTVAGPVNYTLEADNAP